MPEDEKKSPHRQNGEGLREKEEVDKSNINHEQEEVKPKAFTSKRNNPVSLPILNVVAAMKKVLPDDAELVFCVQERAPEDGSPFGGWKALSEAEMRQRHQTAKLEESSLYVGMSAIKRSDDGKLRNRGADFGYALGLVLDDVGTKGKSYEETYAKLPPTWVIESSKGNYQFGYLLDKPCDDFVRMQALVKSAYGSKLTDPGGGLVTKYVRLPAGVRNKVIEDEITGHQSYDDYEVTLKELKDEVRYSLEALEAIFLPVRREMPGGLQQDGSFEYSDALADAIRRSDFYRTTHADGKISMGCPWVGEHGHGSDNAAYWPLGVADDQGRYADIRGCNCPHGCCAGRKGPELAEWFRDQGHDIPHSVELEVALQRYCLVEEGSLVGDLEHGGQVIKYSDFHYSHSQLVQTGVRDNGSPTFKPLAQAWRESRLVAKVGKAVFDPRQSSRLCTWHGKSAFNEYTRFEPMQPKTFDTCRPPR